MLARGNCGGVRSKGGRLTPVICERRVASCLGKGSSMGIRFWVVGGRVG